MSDPVTITVTLFFVIVFAVIVILALKHVQYRSPKWVTDIDTKITGLQICRGCGTRLFQTDTILLNQKTNEALCLKCVSRHMAKLANDPIAMSDVKRRSRNKRKSKRQKRK